MKVYIYRIAANCPYEWAEIETSVWGTQHTYFTGETIKRELPVHPGDLQKRVRLLIAAGRPFATQSDIVLSMLGWMVRKGELKLPTSVVYVDKDGIEYDNPIDTEGSFVMPWPESGFEGIQEAGFHYRFD